MFYIILIDNGSVNNLAALKVASHVKRTDLTGISCLSTEEKQLRQSRATHPNYSPILWIFLNRTFPEYRFSTVVGSLTIAQL